MSSSNSRAKPLVVSGAAIIAIGLWPLAFAVGPQSANTIDPVPFVGVPNGADILKVCNLPKVVNSFSPFGLTLNTLAPVNTPSQIANLTQSGVPANTYIVNVTVTSKNPTRFKYEDVSPIPGFIAGGVPFPPTLPSPVPGDQFFGTRGTEAVSVADGNNTNIYCGEGVIRDSNLGPPGNNAASITFWWVAGPCGLKESDKSSACAIYNTPNVTAAVLRGTLDIPDSPVNSCGCTQILQLCNTKLLSVANALNNVVLCDFNGDGGSAGFSSEATLFGHSPLCTKIGNYTFCG